MSGADMLGRALVAEVEEASLGQILHSARLQHDPAPQRFGIPPLDRLLNLFAQPVQEHASSSFSPPKPPVVEITSLGTGAGKTHLLYLIAAIAVLPRIYSGKASAVVVIDTEGNFLVSRLADIMRQRIKSARKDMVAKGKDEEEEEEEEEEEDEVLAAALAHVHILRPDTHAALLAALAALPAYLFDPCAHCSSPRPLHSILLDSASAFFWPLRAAEDGARALDPASSSSSSATAAAAYAALVRQLRALQKTLECAVVATSASLPSSGPQAQARALRPLLPHTWTGFPTLRLAMAREGVQGRCAVWVDEWGGETWRSVVREGVRAEGGWGVVIEEGKMMGGRV
ncbi:uncharacterized protein K452DRAFT_112169 [Aplosporella prunicola CBS 121167]|uniref:DNA recombination and repair protein Rad51-like C-terminal domain-containing protein n=1 Tax=Aplosporella prunicola CBS 121167 TaxID=1176127 RepID=A0A6A6AZ52_9PEZI|nr:uncharacterized protein K452DRAFT_112169 [Aplosporella prunicola CBS 121167]KAF2137199.1 hypothetical protein K452DRAFT_112169 [Aplosporella prunicola CBS 121167]